MQSAWHNIYKPAHSGSTEQTSPAEQANLAEQKSETQAPKKASENIQMLPVLTGHALTVGKLTERLTDIINKETGLLKERLPSEAQKLHGEKNRVIAEYKLALGKLHMNKQALSNSRTAERAKLKELTDKLRDALREHARIIVRLKTISEGLVRSISEEVNKQANPSMTYGSNAIMAQSQGRMPTSLALNQVI